jgi:hypothetical protein
MAHAQRQSVFARRSRWSVDRPCSWPPPTEGRRARYGFERQPVVLSPLFVAESYTEFSRILGALRRAPGRRPMAELHDLILYPHDKLRRLYLLFDS